MGTRTPTQVKNYFYDSKKTIAKQKENRAKIAKGCAKSATGLKKTKRGKKEIDVKMTTKIQSSIDKNDSASFCAASSNSKDCYSDRDFMNLSLQRVQGHDQQEPCHQHHFSLYHQQQQQFQHQQIQLQQQQLESLVQQQRQEEMYRQQIQQEDMYRQHLRQQEIFQAAQQHQQQHYAEPGHSWNRKSTCEPCFALMAHLILFLFFRPTTSKFAINVVSAPFGPDSSHPTKLPSTSPTTRWGRLWKYQEWVSTATAIDSKFL